MIRTALYARISDDRSGEGLGVARQKDDCHKLAESRGWTVTEEYVDNDISAYSGKARPQFVAMLADIEAGQFDAVVVYHQDRLTRRPAEFEQFLTVCQEAGVKLFATVSGSTDIGQGDGILIARIIAAVAANQSDAASRRIRRKNDERAAAGLPHKTGQRAYGFELDRVTVVESEAAIIRTMAARFQAGESLNSLVSWLQAEGVKTATGTNDWRTPTLRNLIKSPRIAGLREHRGEVVGPAAWPAIITIAQHEQIARRLAISAANNIRSPRRYLLSGRVYCGLCGGKMVSAPDSGRRRYGCRKGPDFGGCGKVYVAGNALDDLIADAVLMRLDTPALAKELAARPSDEPEATALTTEVADTTAQLDELTEAYAARQVTMREWLKAKKPIEERLDASKRRLARLNSNSGLMEYIGQGVQLRQAWTSTEMTLQKQAAIVGTILDRVVIQPATRKSNRMDPARVQPVWSL